MTPLDGHPYHQAGGESYDPVKHTGDPHPHEEPKGIGDIVARAVGPRQIVNCLVTGWYPAASNHEEGHYVLTPIPSGMQASDFGSRFWAAMIDEIPPRVRGAVQFCPGCRAIVNEPEEA